VATIAVLIKKYVVAAPTSGFGSAQKLKSSKLAPIGVPPRYLYIAPATCTVMIRHPMLKSVLYKGLRSLMRKVH
jgi:hypothetical protein